MQVGWHVRAAAVPNLPAKPPAMTIVFVALLLLIAYFLYIAIVDFNEVA